MSSTNPSVADADDDLDGHSIEELSAYLDAGREPRNPHIEASPGCQLALEGMERVRRLSPALLEVDAEREGPVDAGWLTGVLASIARDARSGTRIRIESEHDGADLAITEAAVRGLIRSVEAEVPGALIGRIRFEGDLAAGGTLGAVTVDVALPYGAAIQEAAERIRASIRDGVSTHAELRFDTVNVVVHDIRQPSGLAAEGEK